MTVCFIHQSRREHIFRNALYGFREHNAGICILCVADGKNLAIEGVGIGSQFSFTGDQYLTVPKPDGSYSRRDCQQNIDYRPKICNVESTYDSIMGSCAMDWSRMQLNSAWGCSEYPAHGLFIKTEVYNKLVNECGKTIETSTPKSIANNNSWFNVSTLIPRTAATRVATPDATTTTPDYPTTAVTTA